VQLEVDAASEAAAVHSTAGAGLATGDPLVKRPRRNSEPTHASAGDDTTTGVYNVAPIPRPLVSSIEFSAAVGKLVGAPQAAVAPAVSTDEPGKAATADMAALRGQERAIEATHPTVPPFVREHSQLWHDTAHSGDGAEPSDVSWLLCFEGCPVPLERALDVLQLLAQLHATALPPATRIFHVLTLPLEDCLASVSDADLAAMEQVGDYLQLPKALVAQVAQHAAARALRVAGTSPADLLGALRDGPLLPVLEASLMDLPNLEEAMTDQVPELFPEVDPGLDADPAADPDELELDLYWDLTPREKQKRLLADPCFLQGLCNAPCQTLQGRTGKDPRAVHLAGLLLAGHPLPAKLVASHIAVTAAIAAGNKDALDRMIISRRFLNDFNEYRSPWGPTALNAAAYFGRTPRGTKLLAWVFEVVRDDCGLHSHLSDGAKWCAAASGSVATVRKIFHKWGDEELAAAAAGAGHLPMLQWLRTRGCPWNASTLAHAAAGGHREVLEWAIAQGCPRDARACAGAASAGDLATLRWLREQGFAWDVRCYIAAAEGGHLDVMRYAREHGCDWGAGNQVCRAAARGGSVPVLQWCFENGAAWGPVTCEAAATGGHLDALKFALGRGCPMNENAATAAARHGHTACLAYIFEHDGGRFTDPCILEHAEASLQAECVKLAVAHGCEDSGDDGSGAWWAGANGRIDVAQWLVERAATCDSHTRAVVASDICRGAAYGGWLPVLEWMLEAGHLDVTHHGPALTALGDGASEADEVLPVLQWLHDKGVEFNAQVFERAAGLGDIKVLTWLRDVANCPMSPAVWDAVDAVVDAAPDAAGSTDALENKHAVLKWLCMQPERPWRDKFVLWVLREGSTYYGSGMECQWAIANEPDAAAAVRTRGCAEAIASDSIEMVKLARKHGGEWSAACTDALATASFTMVQHCVADGCGVSEAMFNSAVSVAGVEWAVLEPRLQFLKNKACPWSAATTAAAAVKAEEGSAVTVVRWLLANDCPVDASACAAAAGQFPLSRVVELHELGCPLDGSIGVAAARAGQLDILQWAHSKGCELEGCAGLVVRSAPVRDWLRAQGVVC